MQQQIRFCTTPDGVRIAYAKTGQGPPLVKVANWLSHLEFDWNSPVWRHWIVELSRDHTLVRYDQRGCSLSDWVDKNLSFESQVLDLERVMDALNLGSTDRVRLNVNDNRFHKKAVVVFDFGISY